VTLGAQLQLMSRSGERIVGASEFIDGPMSTIRAEDEILVEARLPLLGPEARFGFYEVNRRAGDFALGMALAVFDEIDGVARNPRIGLGAIEERPLRSSPAEDFLEGKPVNAENAKEAGRLAAEGVDPMSDAAITADYRRDLAAVCIERALLAAVFVERRKMIKERIDAISSNSRCAVCASDFASRVPGR